MNRIDEILKREDEFGEYITNALVIAVRLATAASQLPANASGQVNYVRNLGIEALKVMGVEA